MSQLKNNYSEVVKEQMPKSKHLKNAIMAFIFGGIICTIGQVINMAATNILGFDKANAANFQAVVLIFIGATLTGIGVYDKLGKIAGAGTIVPITGFANSVTAPAMEFRREGYILGVGANMFKIAGPVIVYGTVTSIVYGVIYWIFGVI